MPKEGCVVIETEMGMLDHYEDDEIQHDTTGEVVLTTIPEDDEDEDGTVVEVLQMDVVTLEDDEEVDMYDELWDELCLPE